MVGYLKWVKIVPLSTGKYFFFFNLQAKIIEKLSSPDSNISLW